MDGIYNCKVNIYKSRVSLCFYLNLASNCCVRRKFFWKIIQLIPNRHLYLTLPANYQIMLVDSWLLRAWMSCLLMLARAHLQMHVQSDLFIYLSKCSCACRCIYIDSHHAMSCIKCSLAYKFYILVLTKLVSGYQGSWSQSSMHGVWNHRHISL